MDASADQVLPRPAVLYGWGLNELRRARFFGVSTVAAAAISGVGHAGVALAAGLLAQAVVGRDGPAGAVVRVELLTLGLIGVGATLVKATSSVWLAHLQTTLASRVGNALRLDVARGLLASGRSSPPPATLARIAVRIREVESGTEGAVGVLRAVTQLLPLGIALILVSAPLAIGAVGVLAPFAVLVGFVRGRFRFAAEHAQEVAEELHQHVDELVTNLDLFRTYGAGERVLGALASAGARSGAENARVDALRTGLSGANESLGALAVLGAVMLSEYAGVSFGDGTLLAFCAVFFMAYRPLRDLGDGRSSYQRGQAALDAVHPTLSRAPMPAPKTVPHGMKALRLVQFGCASRGPRVDAVLEPGQLLLLAGPNGSGKTSLLRALLGLEPSTGECCYGADELAHAAVGPEERPFAWVPQDAPLATGTLRDNLGLMGASSLECEAALELLGAGFLSERFGDDVVGPGGRNVSGGERRMVALARAVATQQPVLLLDEPFAGLDTRARGWLFEALKRLKGQRTLIVVSHDPDPAPLADLKLVLD